MRADQQQGRVVVVAWIVAAGMIAQLIVGKAARDAFFLSSFPVTRLPAVMVSSAALSIAVVLLLSRVMSRLSPARVVPWVFVGNSLLFLFGYALSTQHPRAASVFVYLHTAAIGPAAISAFWSMINERFDPHRAKRMVVRIGAGATLGGVVGGVVAWQLADRVSIPTLIGGLAAVNLLCAAGTTRIGTSASVTARPAVPGEAPSALRVLREAPYLRILASFVILAALCEAGVDYVFKATAQASAASTADLVTFFAVFHTGTALLAFLVQTTLAQRSLRAIGLTGTVAFRPAAVLGGGVLVAAWPRLWTTTLLAGAMRVVENSLYRSSYELLYTPLSAERKRPTKALIDVGFDKLGTAIGSGLIMLVIAIAPDRVQSILIFAALGAAGGGLALVTLLHRGYVGALVDSLRRGMVELKAEDLVDRTTHRTLAETTAALDRDKLLQQIEAYRAREAATAGQPEGGEGAVAALSDPVVAALVDLRSGDVDRVVRCLEQTSPMAPALVPCALALLGKKETARASVKALRAVAPRATGQLVDALLDPGTAPSIRRRLPRVLEAAPGQRAVDGLLRGLADPRLEVVEACAASLLALARDDQLSFDREIVQGAALRVAGLGLVPAKNNERSRHLQLTAAILSLVFDHDPLRLAFRAVEQRDEGLVGTGVEYLENVLPGEIYAAVRPYFPHRRPPARVTRPRQEIVDELLTSLDLNRADLIEELRRRTSSSTDSETS